MKFWWIMNKQCSQFLIEIYEHRPVDFKPLVEVAACFLEIDNKLLMLKRASEKLEGGMWGVPGGKIELNETPEEGAYRELFEETGIRIDSQSHFQSFGALYIRKPEVDYVFHQFKVNVDCMLDVCLSDEHEDYIWATPDELMKLSLMLGAKEVIRPYQQRSF